MTTLTGYHFTDDKLRDGSSIPNIGEWLKHGGKIKLRESGLHMCIEPFDSLKYAHWNLLHKVELRGDIQQEKDICVGRERRILQTIDATNLLRQAARKFALDVVHLCDAHEVVKKYLKTGDEELRAEAEAEARTAAVSAYNNAYAATNSQGTWSMGWAVAWAVNNAWKSAVEAATSDVDVLIVADDAAAAAASVFAADKRDRGYWDTGWSNARVAQRKYFNELVQKEFDKGETK